MIDHGPLQWPIDVACDYDTLGVSQEQAAAAEAAAVEWLWQSTAARFGTRVTAWRPQVTPAAPAAVADPFAGLGWLSPAAAGWVAAASITGGCVAPASQTVTVPGPVAAITAVTVDGQVLPSTAWRLAGDLLVRTDGQTWPQKQNVDLPASSVGTWQVTYLRGRPVPDRGQRAAGLLACELAKRLTGAKDCKIPANATTVSKNGTVINLDKAGQLTNVPEVDQWIRSVNPAGQRRTPRVWAPEQRTAAR